MNERYRIIKLIYPDYLIYIDGKLIKKDKLINDYININNYKINKLDLNNLEIENIKKYDDNQYMEVLQKALLIKILKMKGKKVEK